MNTVLKVGGHIGAIGPDLGDIPRIPSTDRCDSLAMARAAATVTEEQPIEKSTVWFDSDQVNCAADLYRPPTMGGTSISARAVASPDNW
jgi:hypothetical protein